MSTDFRERQYGRFWRICAYNSSCSQRLFGSAGVEQTAGEDRQKPALDPEGDLLDLETEKTRTNIDIKRHRFQLAR